MKGRLEYTYYQLKTPSVEYIVYDMGRVKSLNIK
jgi:hypothetical protein